MSLSREFQSVITHCLFFLFRLVHDDWHAPPQELLCPPAPSQADLKGAAGVTA